MSMEVLVPVAGILAVFAAMLVVLKIMRSKGLSFTARVFTALGLGVLLGLGIQLLLGRDGDAATTALDWISIVGQGYIGLLKMLVMPLVFVAIVGAFTRAEVTEHFGRIAFAVLAVLLGTVTVAAVLGWGATVLTGLAHAGFLDAATPDAAELSSLASQQSEAASLTLPQEILSFIPTNPFADLAGARSTSTIAVVIFSAILGVAYIRLRDKDVDQADFFKSLIDSLYGIVMRIVAMVLGLTPYGILALIAKVMAASDYRAILGLGKFVLVSYGALLAVLCVHCLILLANRVNPATYFKKAFPVLSFAFVSRSSAGALPLNIETQHKALGVDSASANLAASFGMSIGQNGCAGVYPAMLATIVAPTVGIDVLSPTFFVPLIAVVAISSFGVAGVGGGATFASLIVLGTMGLPIEVVAVLASVEPLIDMGRTALNVSDSMVAGKKAFPVLSFAFVSRSSAGALPLNIETQHKALGVDSASANLAASFGMSIGQNGCAGVYPAMLATIVAPTVGIDVLSPTFFVPLIAVVAISSFGVAGVGGGATFASLIVLGTMGLPIEVVAVLASVEPLIDMGRTALNVSDSMVAGITASHVAGGLDRSVLDDPEARVTAEAHVS